MILTARSTSGVSIPSECRCPSGCCASLAPTGESSESDVAQAVPTGRAVNQVLRSVVVSKRDATLATKALQPTAVGALWHHAGQPAAAASTRSLAWPWTRHECSA